MNSHYERLLKHPNVREGDGQSLQEFIDTFNEGLRALGVIEQKDEHFNSIISYTEQKLDPSSKQVCILQLADDNVPHYED